MSKCRFVLAAAAAGTWRNRHRCSDSGTGVKRQQREANYWHPSGDGVTSVRHLHKKYFISYWSFVLLRMHWQQMDWAVIQGVPQNCCRISDNYLEWITSGELHTGWFKLICCVSNFRLWG